MIKYPKPPVLLMKALALHLLTALAFKAQPKPSTQTPPTAPQSLFEVRLLGESPLEKRPLCKTRLAFVGFRSVRVEGLGFKV